MARLGLCLLVLMAALVVGSSLLSARSDPLTLRYGDTRSAIFTPDTPVQRWTFTAAAGEMVRLRGQRIGGQATPRLRLLDSAGTLLAESTAGAADAATLLYDSGFAVAGTYTVEVTAAGLFVNPAENPDEYSLTLTRTGQRRARRDEGLTPLPAVTADLTTLESGTPAPALGLRVYGGATLERPDARNQPNRYLLTQGDWQIVLQNASPGPISSGVGSLSFTPAGIGLVTGNPRRPRAVLFTDQNFEIAYDTPNGIYTLRLANGQTIITDFYRIDSLIAREGLVLAQMTYTDPTGALLPRVGLFSGTLIDLRRRSGQAINEVPINEFRLENDQFIFTDFTRWDTLAYVAGQLRVLIGQDTRVLLRPVQAVLQTERGRPDFYELRLTHAGGTLRLLSDLQLMGDIAALDGTLTLAPLDGRSLREPLATTLNVLTEAGAVRFERLNQPNQFRTVLPDGTEIETPLPAPDDPAALPHEAGYVPAGYNNLGSRPLPLCPCVNALAAAAPLNPVNGNFHYAVADVTVPSHGLPLTFTRYYNSQYRRSSPAYLAAQPGLGAGWRHTYQIELDITDAPLERVTLWLADGARHRFVAIAPGSARYRSTTLLSLTLERQGGLLGTWQAFAADGTVYTFDRAGRLERISAAPGGSLALSPLPQDYGPGGWLVVDAYGRRLEIYTDAGGRIVRLRDSLLRDFTYEYDASGSYLTGVRYISPALTASYQYNDDDRLIALDDVRSPLTQRVSLSYDGRGRIQQALTGAAADGSGDLATDYSYAAGQTEQRVTVSGAVRVTTWRYDERFLLTETISPRREVSTGFVYDAVSGLPVSYRTATRASYQFQFDAPGNLIRLNDPFLTGINDGFLFTYTQRDTLSLLTQLEYPGEVVEQFTYGEAPAGQRPLLLSRRRLVQATPARRWAETRYEYDERGRVVLLVEPGIDDSDTATVFVYDTAGYPAEIWQGIAIAPEETRLNLTPERALRRLRLTYDLTGRLRALQDGTGSLYTLTYDSATDRLIAITLPEGVRLAYTYDARGNLLTVEERGQVLRYRYDTFDRLIEIRTPEDHTTRYTYDEAGNVLTETDALGRVFRYAYDALNQPVQHIAPDGAITTYETVYDTTASRIERREVLPSGRSLVRRLDALGRLRQMTITEAGFQQEYLLDYSVNGYPTLIKENFSGRTITLAYDLSGQLLTASIAGLTTRYDYDRAGHLVQVTGAGGQRTTYTYDRLGNVTGSTLPDGSRLSYAYDAAGNVTEATDAAGQTTRYTYDALHQLRRQLAPDGSSTDYRYDSRGNLTEIVDALGQTRTFTYDLFDRLTGAVDASGEETLYTYDAIGRLTAVAQPAGRSVRYGYDLAGNLIATTLSPLQRRTLYSYDAAGRLTGVTNPLGQTLAYAYNGFGRLSSASDPVGNTQQFEWRSGTLSPAGYLSTGGLRLRFLSDDFGRLTDIRDAASDSTQGRVARLTYDDDGFITAIITGTGSVPDSQAWRYTYDAAGRILSVTEPAGGVWVLAYDAAGQVASLTDPGGSITRYERDAAGRITRRLRQAGTAAETGESFAYDAGGNLIAYTGPGGTVHRYTYDASHRLTEAVLAAGTPAAQTYRFEYNGQGQVTLLQLPSGLTTRYIYSLDNIARAEMQAGETSIIYRYEYDEAGNLIRLVLPDVDGEPAAIITLSYDAPGRLVRYADSTGSVRAYTYDSAGNLSQISDPTGSTGRYEYDLYRRVTRLLLPGDTEVRLSYNPDGYPASVTLPPGAEGARQTIQYTVDEAGRVTAIRQGDTLLRQFTYDARGQLIARQDAAGVLTCYSYDSAGHVVAAVYRQRGSACDGDPADIRATLGYTYDAAGNRLTVTRDNNPAAAFRYDALNRPVSVQRGDLALTYTYDAAGNVQSRAAGPYGSARYTYDAFQRLIRIDYGTDSLTLSYDARSNLREIARSNGVRSLYNYDAAGRIVRILHVNAADERLDGFNYRYDAEGNLIVVDRVTDNWRILYSYDVAHRLIGERWLNENGETVYTLAVRYDAAGNRLEVIRNGRSTRYSYNALNQLISEERSLPEGGTLALAYRYNAAGSVVSITCVPPAGAPPPCDLAFSYDDEQRLLGVVGIDPAGQRVDTRLSYDPADGSLTGWRAENIGRFNVYMAEGRLLALRNTSPGAEATETYLALNARERLLTITGDGRKLWALNDATGSPRRFVDADGQPVEVAGYRQDFNSAGEQIFPYGPDTAAPGLATGLLPQFGGQLYDPSTGLYLNGLRACDPASGRFLQLSPVFQEVEGTPYTCARNRPFIYSGANGLEAVPLHSGALRLPVTVSPEALIVRPDLPDLPLPPATAPQQNDEFFRAWQLIAATRYGTNDIVAQLAPGLDDFYIAGLNPVPATVRDWLAQPLRASMALYTPGRGWLPALTPDPMQQQGRPLAVLARLDTLLLTLPQRPPALCPVATPVPLRPSLRPPLALPAAWQQESALQSLLPPVPQSEPFLPDLLRRTGFPFQMPGSAPPLTPAGVGQIGTASTLLARLEALRQQQRDLLAQMGIAP